MRMPLVIESDILDPTDTILPTPPDLVGKPCFLGALPIPSRFGLAPMAGYTSLAYRLALRKLGGLGQVTTDLVNARALLESRSRSFELAETCAEDRPVAIQIYGGIVDEMRQVDDATRLVAAVVDSVEVPVTVKMRLGWDDSDLSAPFLARAFEQVGAAGVVIHGRTREQGFKGVVDRAGIKAVVDAVDRIPVVGNGDVRTIADAERMFRETGCAAVSIGRGALGNPFLFRQLAHWAEHGDPGPDPTFEERVDVMVDHFHGLVDRRTERHACFQFRKLVKWYNHAIRPRKDLYHRLINLSSVALFDETVVEIRREGPTSPLPGHFEPRVPVPSGPIEKW